MIQLLTRYDVAKALQVSTRTVDRLRKRRLLTDTNVFGAVRFRIDDVNALLEKLRENGSALVV